MRESGNCGPCTEQPHPTSACACTNPVCKYALNAACWRATAPMMLTPCIPVQRVAQGTSQARGSARGSLGRWLEATSCAAPGFARTALAALGAGSASDAKRGTRDDAFDRHCHPVVDLLRLVVCPYCLGLLWRSQGGRANLWADLHGEALAYAAAFDLDSASRHQWTVCHSYSPAGERIARWPQPATCFRRVAPLRRFFAQCDLVL